MALQTIAATDGLVGRMAASATGIGNSLGEDVSNEILNITPTDTPLLSTLKKTKATAVYHEWLTDSLAAASTTVLTEGAAYGQLTYTPRTRRGNYCAIQNRVYVVSNTLQAVSQYGLSKELSLRLVNAMKEIKRDVEATLWAGTSAVGDTGASDSARGYDGFNEIVCQVAGASGNSGDALSDSGIAHLSNAATETTFNSVLQDIFDDGGNPTIAYMTPAVKKKFSRWATATTNRSLQVDQNDKKLVNVVNVYESDFGLVKLVMDRFMPTALSGGANKGTATCVCGDFSYAAIAYLRPFATKTTEATLRDAMAGIVEVEYTLEYGDPHTFGAIKFVSGSGA
jgi:hypothetical protein